MSIFGSRWSPQDVGVTLASFANDAANEVVDCDAEWFGRNPEAEEIVRRYTTAAAWMFAQGSASFMALRRPDPNECLEVFRLNRLAWLASSADASSEEEIWAEMYEDADRFARHAAAPETRTSGQPIARIAKEWFAETAPLPLFDYLPSRSAIHLVSVTGQLHAGVAQLSAKVG